MRLGTLLRTTCDYFLLPDATSASVLTGGITVAGKAAAGETLDQAMSRLYGKSTGSTLLLALQLQDAYREWRAALNLPSVFGNNESLALKLAIAAVKMMVAMYQDE